MPETELISESLPVYLPPSKVAARLGMTEKGLFNWRKTGKGPPWVKLVGSIRYREDYLEEWLHQQIERSVKENGKNGNRNGKATGKTR